MSDSVPEISVVIPVYNEAGNITRLFEELSAAMDDTGKSYEVIAVDDGSSDSSFAELREVHLLDKRWRIVRLARNFGQNPALYAGFEHARGLVIVTIDADLQNPPEDIPALVAKLEEGYEVVQGWREQRQDSLFRKLASRAVNATVSTLTKVHIKDLGSGMKAYRREVIERLCLARHHARYLPAETAWLNVKIGEVKVGHRNRHAGESKYGIWALLRVNFDMIASISTAPIKLIGLVGLSFAFIGFAMALRILYLRLTLGNFNELASVSALFFFLGGVQLICTSIMCEYVSRIYSEVQNRPYYIVGEVIE